MAEYIERQKAIDLFYPIDPENDGSDGCTVVCQSGNYSSAEIESMLSELPAADVAPVRHGRWESVKNPQWPAYSHDKCSICGWWNTKNALCYDNGHKPGHSLNYCPNCGARMDG